MSEDHCEAVARFARYAAAMQHAHPRLPHQAPQSVLIVEDDELVRTMVANVLSSAGFEVDAVETGEAALAIIASARPALIILDMNLPGLDGLGVLREIVHLPSLPPVLAMSAQWSELEWSAVECGAVGFLRKPISAKSLLSAVDAALTGRLVWMDADVLRVLAASPDPLLIINHVGTVVFASSRVEEVLGFAPHELVKQPVEVLVPEGARGRHTALREAFVFSGSARPMQNRADLRARHKSGHEIPVEIGLSVIGRRLERHIVCTIRDVSEQRRLERELREALAEIERRSAKALAESHRETDEAKHLAIQANEFKSRLLAAANHDLRQPLQALEFYLAAIRSRSEREETTAICDKAGQALRAMSIIIDGLLDISSLEKGVINPSPRPFPVQDFLDRIAASNGPQAHGKGLSLQVETTSVTGLSDPDLLERVVGNFVSNAVRYTSHGKIMLSAQSIDSHIVISVRDTGIGIPRDRIEDIFQDYLQLANPERDPRKGLGIGLSIAKRIADLLGHEISVTSREGEGSNFSVSIPEAELRAAVATEATPPLSDTAPLVLIVDDEATISEAMSLVLRIDGYRVRSARSGEEALRLIQDSRLLPDLVLSDFRLPGMNGLQLIRQIREVASATVPCVLITGDTTLDGVETAGCTLAHKPVAGATLLQIARKALQPT